MSLKRHSQLYATAGSALLLLMGAAMSHLPQAVPSSYLPSFLAPFDPLTCNHQVTKELRDDLLAGNRWRAPFTATALSSCELYLLHAEDFQRVSQFTGRCSSCCSTGQWVSMIWNLQGLGCDPCCTPRISSGRVSWVEARVAVHLEYDSLP